MTQRVRIFEILNEWGWHTACDRSGWLVTDPEVGEWTTLCYREAAEACAERRARELGLLVVSHPVPLVLRSEALAVARALDGEGS